MKKLIFAMSAFAALSLLAPSAGFAQQGVANEVGLYINPDGTGGSGTFVVGSLVDVFLVLINPTDVENGNMPYTTISSFGCTLNFNPVPNMDLFHTGEVFPPTGVNTGNSTNINQGFLEYIVGMPTPMPVTDGSVLLVALTFLNTQTTSTIVSLGPSSSDTIVGQMFYQSELGQPRAMYSVGGSHSAAVFIFNGQAVDVEDESFGSVKALFR